MHNVGFEDEVGTAAGTAAGTAQTTRAPVILDSTNSFTADEVGDLYDFGKFVTASESIFGLTIFLVLVQWELPRIAQSFTVSSFGYSGMAQLWSNEASALIRRVNEGYADREKRVEFMVEMYYNGHMQAVTMPLFSISMIVALTQGALLWYIWKSLTAIGDSPFCQNYTLLHLMVVNVVIIQMFNQSGDLMNDQACLGAKVFVATKDKDKNERCLAGVIPHSLGKVYMGYIILFQQLLLVVFAVVGIRYVLQQDGASNIVQACVALQFILDIDNYVYQLLITDSMKEVIRSVKFSMRNHPKEEEEPLSLNRGRGGGGETRSFLAGFVRFGGPRTLSESDAADVKGLKRSDTIGFALSVFSPFALIVVLSLAIVLGLRTTYCPVVVNRQGAS